MVLSRNQFDKISLDSAAHLGARDDLDGMQMKDSKASPAGPSDEAANLQTEPCVQVNGKIFNRSPSGAPSNQDGRGRHASSGSISTPHRAPFSHYARY
jgi:hypothetical protein